MKADNLGVVLIFAYLIGLFLLVALKSTILDKYTLLQYYLLFGGYLALFLAVSFIYRRKLKKLVLN